MTGGQEVLLACPSFQVARALVGTLGEFGLRPLLTASVAESRAILARRSVSLVVCEANLPDGDFRDILDAVARTGSTVPVIVAFRFGDTDTRSCLEAIRAGAFAFLAWPYSQGALERTVRTALSAVLLSQRGRNDAPCLVASR